MNTLTANADKSIMKPPTCPSPCHGINVTHMRRGDPIVYYRDCIHGKALKTKHADMTPQQIRSSLVDAVKFHPAR